MTTPDRVPDFLGIGCQNCGTTWMAACLAQHPDIFIPAQKELSYFDQRYELGWEWYLRQFRPGSESAVLGEWSPGYICHPQAFERVVEHLPDIRIIILLRDPTARMFSHYLRYRSKGATHLPFEQAIESDPAYVRMSLYADDWSRWVEHFGRERSHVVVFEELIADPVKGLKAAFEFLGVETAFTPDTDAVRSRQNALRVNRHQWIMDAVARSRKRLRGSLLSPVVDLAKRLGVNSALKRLAGPRQAGYQGWSLSDEQRFAIHARYFQADVSRLQQLLPKHDLSRWTPPKPV